MECCGADYPTDWNQSKNIIVGANLEGKTFSIPESCCQPSVNVETCKKATQNIRLGSRIDYDVIFKRGCVSKVVNVVHNNMSIVLIVAIIIIITEFVGLLFSLILAFAVGSSHNYKR